MTLCMNQTLAIQVQMKAAKRKMTVSIMHQKAVVETTTRSLIDRRSSIFALSLSILSAIFRQIASPSCSSVRLASSLTVTVLASCREETTQSGQGFRESAFKFLHLVTKNADGLVIVFQRVGQAVFLLHPFGYWECRAYF